MASTSFTTPVSLFTHITAASTVSSRSAAATDAGSIRPSPSGSSQVTCQPSRSRRRAASSTALCSMRVVTRWRPRSAKYRAAPMTARLSASVAPDVKTSSSGRAPSSVASSARAASTAAAARRPGSCISEAALPYTPSRPRQCAMAAATASSTGVVAA